MLIAGQGTGNTREVRDIKMVVWAKAAGVLGFELGSSAFRQAIRVMASI